MKISGSTPQTGEKKQAKSAKAENRPLPEKLPQDWVELSGSKERSEGLNLIPRPKSFMGAGEAIGQAKRPYHAPHGDHWHPSTDESERTPEVVAQQEKRVQESLDKKAGVTFQNSEGKSLEVQITKTAGGYQYQMKNGTSVSVSFDKSYDDKAQRQALAKLIDYQSQMPKGFDQHLTEISMEKEGAMGNTAARREGSKLRFFGAEQLNESNFSHEFGHIVGSAVESEEDTFAQRMLGGLESRIFSGRSHSAPDTWAKTMADDKRDISGYAVDTINTQSESLGLAEDFAETFTAYHEARESGPEALAEFRKLYPKRAQAMDKIWNR